MQLLRMHSLLGDYRLAMVPSFAMRGGGSGGLPWGLAQLFMMVGVGDRISTDTLHQSTCNPNKEYVGGMYCIYDLGSNGIMMWGIYIYKATYKNLKLSWFLLKVKRLQPTERRASRAEKYGDLPPRGQRRQHPNTVGESFNQMGEVKQQFNQEMKIDRSTWRMWDLGIVQACSCRNEWDSTNKIRNLNR